MNWNNKNLNNKIITIITVLVCSVEIIIFLGLFLLTQNQIWFTIGLSVSLFIFLVFVLFKSISSLYYSDTEREKKYLDIKSRTFDTSKIKNESNSFDKKKKEISKNTENIKSLISDYKEKETEYNFKEEISELIKEIQSNIQDDTQNNYNFTILDNLKTELIEEVDSTIASKFDELTDKNTTENKSFKEELTNLIDEKIKNSTHEFSNKLEDNINSKFDQLNQDLETSILEKIEGKLKQIEITESSIAQKLKSVSKKPEKSREIKEKEEKKEELIEPTVPQELEKGIKPTPVISSTEPSEKRRIIILPTSDQKTPTTPPKAEEKISSTPSQELEKIKKPAPPPEPEPEPPHEEKKPTVDLAGKQVEIIQLDELKGQIEYDGNNFKIQKNMYGKSIDDLRKIEDRINKFFRNRNIIIVLSRDKNLYYIYYQV
jgi:hypothetical protein